MQTNLKALANSFSAFDGAVAFHIMGYNTLQTGKYIQALERVEPQFEYVNSSTGEVTHDEPDAYRKAVEAAEATSINVPSDWERNRLWTEMHDLFWMIVPLTVDIEFRLTKKAPAAAKALQTYWQNANGSVAHNWMLFTHILPAEAVTVWAKAYNATRDEDFAAPDELQQGEPDKDADPNE